MDMVRADRLLAHPSFLENLQKNREAETDRRFCRHDMTHFLDVARIGTLINLEEGQEIPKDLIYGAALLHDLGRHEQYREGIPHEQAGAAKAPSILSDCGYDREEAEAVLEQIFRTGTGTALCRAMFGLEKGREEKGGGGIWSC